MSKILHTFLHFIFKECLNSGFLLRDWQKYLHLTIFLDPTESSPNMYAFIHWETECLVDTTLLAS